MVAPAGSAPGAMASCVSLRPLLRDRRLSKIAWQLFENTPPGWARCGRSDLSIIHRLRYEHARATKTAWEAYNEGKGVCRDYAHLAIAFCRMAIQKEIDRHDA